MDTEYMLVHLEQLVFQVKKWSAPLPHLFLCSVTFSGLIPLYHLDRTRGRAEGGGDWNLLLWAGVLIGSAGREAGDQQEVRSIEWKYWWLNQWDLKFRQPTEVEIIPLIYFYFVYPFSITIAPVAKGSTAIQLFLITLLPPSLPSLLYLLFVKSLMLHPSNVLYLYFLLSQSIMLGCGNTEPLTSFCLSLHPVIIQCKFARLHCVLFTILNK